MNLSESSVLICLTENQFSKGCICIYLLIHIQICISSLRFGGGGGRWAVGFGVCPFSKMGSKRHQMNSALDIGFSPPWFWRKSGWLSQMSKPTWECIGPGQHDCGANYTASGTKSRTVWVLAKWVMVNALCWWHLARSHVLQSVKGR